MRRRIALAMALVLTGAMTASVAPVAAQEDPATQKAQRLFKRGEKLFARGRFEEALASYQGAFEAKKLPELLFNIGQCYRNLGDYESAIASYRRFLKLRPKAPNRRSVELTIEELETTLARRESGRDPLVAPQRPRDSERDGGGRRYYQHWGFWAGVAVLAAGATAGTLYLSDRSGGPPPSDLGNLDFNR